MINLFTAVPGAGKTQYIVEKLLNLRLDEEKTNPENPVRRVIFTNINGIDPSLGCCSMSDFQDWRKAPDGTLFIIDEAQYVFPTRNSSQKAPEWIESLSTHRHNGYDFWLVSQNPKLIDPHVRSLVDGHWHGYRPFGAPHTIWSFYNECCENPASRVKPIREKRKFNAEIFKFYKSTTIDTYKNRMPYKLFLKYGAFLGLAVGLFGTCIFYMYKISRDGAGIVENKKPAVVSVPSAHSTTAVSSTSEPRQLGYVGFSGFQTSDSNKKIVSFLFCEPPAVQSSSSFPQQSASSCARNYSLNDFEKWFFDTKSQRILLYVSESDEHPAFFVSSSSLLRDLDSMQMLAG